MKTRLVIGIGIGSLLAACQGTNNPGNGGGGGSVQPGVKVQGLYIANSDDTTVARLDLDTHVVRPFQVGKEPSRIARAGTRVYVSLRNERAVAVLDEKTGDLEQISQIKTGAEPFGVAANDTRVYVASSVGGTVDEFDAKTFESLRSWQIAGEPKWVALHPSNRSLYVGATYGGKVTRIDLETGRTELMPVPQIIGFSSSRGSQVPLTARVTGDLIASPDGKHVFAPMLYVDNTSQIPDVTGVSSTTPPQQCGFGMGAPPPTDPANGGGKDTGMGGSGTGSSGGGSSGGGAPVDPPTDMGCGGGYDSQKFNPVVTALPVDPSSGVPSMSEAPEAIIAQGFIFDSTRQIGQQINGYPSAVQITSDSKLLLVTIEGASAVIAINMDVASNSGPQTGFGGAQPPSMGGDVFPGGGTFGNFSSRPSVAILTGSGPRGIALLDDHHAYVHAFFDHQIEELNLDAVRTQLASNNGGGVVGLPVPLGAPNAGGAVDDKGGSSSGGAAFSNVLRTSKTTIVTAATLSADREEGRKLFFAANNPVMATVGAGVSCATCHFDGRTDGVTWSFHRGNRQTPMLAVDLQNALPVGWAGNVATVADEGFNTSQKLMGGHGISPSQIAAVQEFLFGQRLVDTPTKGSNDPRVQHGLEVFAQIGCASCHNGASHTNNQVYSMLGLSEVKTRPLASIAASAPYFHDGSSPSLEDVVDRAARGEMGMAFSISASDKGDLVEFLKSL